MKKRIGLIILLCVFPYWLIAQSNKFGVPLLRNYTPDEYKANEQNMAVVQDHRGIMYFGNFEGVLEYDGEYWRIIQLPNNSMVRSLALDVNGTVIVGAVGEFGCLLPDKLGTLQYHSYSSQLDSANMPTDVWCINVLNDGIYFNTFKKLYRYDGQRINKIWNMPRFSFFSFVDHNQLYLSNRKDGLYILHDDSLIYAKGNTVYSDANIFTLQPFDNENLLIFNSNIGLSTYNKLSGIINSKFAKPQLNKVLIESICYSSTILPSGLYGLATLQSGVYVINQNAEPAYQLNRNTGLMDETVPQIYYNKNTTYSQPVWMALNTGIAKAEMASPIRIFNELNGLKGTVEDIVKFGDKIFAATSSGVFFVDTKTDQPRFKQVQDIQGQTWSLLRFNIHENRKGKNILLVGSSLGLFQISESFAQASEIASFYTFKLYQSHKDSTQIYIGYDQGLSSLNYKNGSWQNQQKYEQINGTVRFIIEDTNNDLWVGTDYDGVYRMTQPATGEPVITKFDVSSGLPSLNIFSINLINAIIQVATDKGLFAYDAALQRFIPSKLANNRFSDGTKAINWVSTFDNKLMINLTHGARTKTEQLTFTINNAILDSVSYLRLPNQLISVFYNDSNITWIGSSDEIYTYDHTIKRTFVEKYPCHIRRVMLGEDSIIFDGTFYAFTKSDTIVRISDFQPKSQIPILNYKNNSIIFAYAAPFFEDEEATEYSYFLDGLSENWSRWSKDAKVSFNNLFEGDYVFKVKAKNVYGVESTIAEYTFVVNPPWFRTIVAYISYLILLTLLIWAIVKLNARRLILEKVRLEAIVRERTTEIRDKNVILEQQNEEITRQKDEIEHKNREITASINYARRIQNAVIPPADPIAEVLPEHFILWRPRDIVSGDFYWMRVIHPVIESVERELAIIIAADCTGHGVPGAFMSMLGVSLLNGIVNNREIVQASDILNELRTLIKRSLQQTGKEGEAKDGMDLALCIIDLQTKILQFSGANNPLYLVRNIEKAKANIEGYEVTGESSHSTTEFIQLKPDRMPIGIYYKERSFTNHSIQLVPDDKIYIFSDGVVDQFGGNDKQKFMSKRLKELLLDIYESPMNEQKKILESTMDNWRGSNHQTDDIILIGVQI